MELVALTFVVALLASVMSGMSGGGGGFITMPYFLFIGLPPANALATAKLGGIGVAAGAITAFRGKGLVSKKLVVPFMTITFVCALIAAWLIPRIEPGVFENMIGAALLILIPTLFIKSDKLQPGARSTGWIVTGFILYTIISFFQTVVGTGVGSFLLVVMMFLFGLTALEANATKRVAQIVQAALLFVLLAFQGLVVWTHGIAALSGGLIGSHIGSRMAIKRGDHFVKIILGLVMLVSGIVLLTN